MKLFSTNSELNMNMYTFMGSNSGVFSFTSLVECSFIQEWNMKRLPFQLGLTQS